MPYVRPGWLALALVAVGCGRFGFDISPIANESDVDAAVVADADDFGCGTEEACTLVDGFDQATLRAPLTAYADGACSGGIETGAYRLSFTGTANLFCGIRSNMGRTATGAVTIDSTGFVQNNRFVTYFQIQDGAGTNVEFQLTGANLNLNLNRGGVTRLAQVTYSPAAHRFWRIRLEPTTVALEASADQASWTQLASLAPPFASTQIFLNFGAGFVVAGGGTATFALAGINAP